MRTTGRLAAALGISGTLLASAPLHAQAPPLLEPTTPWNVDYADSECRLLRTFGSGDKAVTLRLARGGNTGTIDMVVAGRGVPVLPQRLPIEMKLDPQGPAQRVSGYSMAIPGGGGRFVRWFDADLNLLEHANENQIVQFSNSKAFSVRLNLTMVHAALKALDTCYSDLLAGWGASPEDVAILMATQDASSTGSGEVTAQRLDLPKPKGNPGAWATTADYPTDALRQEQSGNVTVMLKVDAMGLPTFCVVVVSSKVASLDTATCKVLQSRAKYKAALDAAGKPRQSVRIERIRWSIPQD